MSSIAASHQQGGRDARSFTPRKDIVAECLAVFLREAKFGLSGSPISDVAHLWQAEVEVEVLT